MRRKAVLALLALLLPWVSVFADPLFPADASVSEPATLSLPRNLLGKPLLFGSRLVEVNRSGGKVFAKGQRGAYQHLVKFVPGDSATFVLLPERDSAFRGGKPAKGPHKGGKPGKGFRPLVFPLVAENDSVLTLDLSSVFLTWPECISAIPPKMLPGRAVCSELSDIRSMPSYLQLTGHWRYADGLDVVATCYWIVLKETPMEPRIVDPSVVGYNGVDAPKGGKPQAVEAGGPAREASGRRPSYAHRWDLSGGRTIDFYVDKRFPEGWYPYIKEGIEDWNKAFTALGLPAPLAVYPEPETFDPASPLVNRVLYLDVEESNAKGDVLADPRSGEILQADILWWKNVKSLLQGWRYVQTGAADPQARQKELPLELLGPMIRHAICHEMGHALGLSHNMGASWAYPARKLHDRRFTQEYGTAASVMDYARYNHLATAADVRRGVSLLPPRLGPYDYFAIACGYGPEGSAKAGKYCYFAPFISAAISPDPSAQAETLGDDLLYSSRCGIRNCRALLSLDGLDEDRLGLLRKQYYRYITLTLSNIGGAVQGKPVSRSVRRKTLEFVFDALETVPAELADGKQERQILDELVGNFLPQRLFSTKGKTEILDYYKHLSYLCRKHPRLKMKDGILWKQFN
ncbi:MAG: zinc-dependent metalloprotease [Bacteroidales bacterium]|nr:zinc-dependent metalloprotease [Bacteroidales bacterium]